jgi:hypothetical protein
VGANDRSNHPGNRIGIASEGNGCPDGITIVRTVCESNVASAWDREVSLDPISERLNHFPRLKLVTVSYHFFNLI